MSILLIGWDRVLGDIGFRMAVVRVIVGLIMIFTAALGMEVCSQSIPPELWAEAGASRLTMHNCIIGLMVLSSLCGFLTPLMVLHSRSV